MNAHLYSNHVSESPVCSCGYRREDAEHYLLRCQKYITQRRRLLNIPLFDEIDVDTHKLLYGSEELDEDGNKTLFKAVQTYIKTTQRFD